ncbi:MAG: DUF4293 domain-containing protein [Solitalea-like symbiont of Acarus siro]
MIQRIQTVFLLIAAIATIFLIITPLVNYKEVLTDSNIQVYVLFTKINNNQIIYSPINIVLLIIILIIPIANIFFYRNRKLQIKLCYLNVVLTVFLVMLISYKLHKLNESSYNNWQVQLGIALFSINIISVLLAKHFIEKDQKLIESSNRLR